MICPHIVDWSMLLGAVLAYGVMWPAIAREAGNWYPAGLKERDFSGLYGYKVRRLSVPVSARPAGPAGDAACRAPSSRRACSGARAAGAPLAAPRRRARPDAAPLTAQVFLAMAVFLGEGIYHFVKIFVVSLASFLAHSAAERRAMPVTNGDVDAIEAHAAPAPRPGLPVLSHGLARAACHRAGAAGSKQHWPGGRADAAWGRQADFKQEQVTGAAAAKSPPANVPVDRMPANGGAALADAAARPEAESGQGAEVLDAEDSAALEALRNDVFMRGAIPWCARPPGRAPTHAMTCSPARGPGAALPSAGKREGVGAHSAPTAAGLRAAALRDATERAGAGGWAWAATACLRCWAPPSSRCCTRSSSGIWCWRPLAWRPCSPLPTRTARA